MCAKETNNTLAQKKQSQPAPTPPRLLRRARLQRQRVQAGFELGAQGGVHQPVPRDGGAAIKGSRNNVHPKVGLPAARVAGVAGVLVGLVDDGEDGRGEGGFQLAVWVKGGWVRNKVKNVVCSLSRSLHTHTPHSPLDGSVHGSD